MHRRGDNAHGFMCARRPMGVSPPKIIDIPFNIILCFRPADERAMPGLSDRIIAPTETCRIVVCTGIPAN